MSRSGTTDRANFNQRRRAAASEDYPVEARQLPPNFGELGRAPGLERDANWGLRRERSFHWQLRWQLAKELVQTTEL
jgi:hypothetical protein